MWPRSSFGSLGFPHVQLGVEWKEGVNDNDRNEEHTFRNLHQPRSSIYLDSDYRRELDLLWGLT